MEMRGYGFIEMRLNRCCEKEAFSAGAVRFAKRLQITRGVFVDNASWAKKEVFTFKVWYVERKG